MTTSSFLLLAVGFSFLAPVVNAQETAPRIVVRGEAAKASRSDAQPSLQLGTPGLHSRSYSSGQAF